MKRKFLENKKGQEELYNVIFQLIFIIFIFSSLILFVNNAAKNNLIKQQALTKELALSLDFSGSGTTFRITSPFAITFGEKDVFVDKKSYSFFSILPVNCEQGVPSSPSPQIAQGTEGEKSTLKVKLPSIIICKI